METGISRSNQPGAGPIQSNAVKKVLIAENDRASSEILREFLLAQGFAVVDAADGADARHKIQRYVPDLIFLDIQTPRIDGLGVLRWLRQHPRLARLRVAALTGSAVRGDRERTLEIGFDAYISKPVTPSSLAAEVGKLLGKQPA